MSSILVTGWDASVLISGWIALVPGCATSVLINGWTVILLDTNFPAMYTRHSIIYCYFRVCITDQYTCIMRIIYARIVSVSTEGYVLHSKVEVNICSKFVAKLYYQTKFTPTYFHIEFRNLMSQPIQ